MSMEERICWRARSRVQNETLRE